MAAPKKKTYAKTYLTDKAVEQLSRPAKGRKSISDVETGLFLWVTATGKKSWAVVTNQKGSDRKQRKVIGHWPTMGVAEARTMARDFLAATREGVALKDKVAEEQAAAEQAEAEQQAGTFEAVAEAYVAAMKAGQLVGGRKRPVTQTTATARERLLAQRVLPDLGDRPLTVREIDAQLAPYYTRKKRREILKALYFLQPIVLLTPRPRASERDDRRGDGDGASVQTGCGAGSRARAGTA